MHIGEERKTMSGITFILLEAQDGAEVKVALE